VTASSSRESIADLAPIQIRRVVIVVSRLCRTPPKSALAPPREASSPSVRSGPDVMRPVETAALAERLGLDRLPHALF